MGGGTLLTPDCNIVPRQSPTHSLEAPAYRRAPRRSQRRSSASNIAETRENAEIVSYIDNISDIATDNVSPTQSNRPVVHINNSPRRATDFRRSRAGLIPSSFRRKPPH